MGHVMPTVEQILESLQAIANQWHMLAIFWHLVFAVLALVLVAGRLPSRGVTALLLALPMFSVSLLAWLAANPFNGVAFLAIGVALTVSAWRMAEGRPAPAPRRFLVPGVLMFAFGWGYPHFLGDASPLAYLYAAPTGLVPCPTLAIVIGVTLILDGFGSRSWCYVLGASGVFYGIYGAGRLGVALDAILLIGALVLLARAYTVARWNHDHAAP